MIARRLGALLFTASEAAQEAGNEALRPLAVTVRHFGILTLLAHAGGAAPGEHEPRLLKRSGRAASPLSQQAVGEALRIDRTTMVGLVDELERAGYVRRERNPADRRAYVLGLTSEGAEMQRRAEQSLDEAAESFFASLAEGERRELGAMLLRLIDRPAADG